MYKNGRTHFRLYRFCRSFGPCRFWAERRLFSGRPTHLKQKRMTNNGKDTRFRQPKRWNLFVLTFLSVGRHSARCLQRPSARGCFVRLFHVEQFECSILKVAPKKRRTISLAALCKTECSMWNNATESLGCCPIKAAASAGDALQKSCKNRCFYSPSKKPAGIPAFLTQSRSVWPFGFVETSVDVAANDS